MSKADALHLSLPCVDKDGQAENCSHNALYVREVLQTDRPIAIPLLVGGFTRYLISFVPLDKAIPVNTIYADGSGRGVQISIDRVGSYALGWGKEMQEEGYLSEKWGCPKPEAKFLLFFFNSVLTGRDCFKTYGKDVMHKLLNGKKAKLSDELKRRGLSTDDEDEVEVPF